TLPLVVGVDWRDPSLVPMPLGDPKMVALSNLRVAFHTDNGIVVPTTETVAVVRAAARVLADAGIAIEEARPQGIEQTYDLYFGFFAADGGTGLQKRLQMLGTAEISPLLQQSLKLFGPYLRTTTEFFSFIVNLDLFRSTMLTFLEKYDVILCPVNAYPALPHGTTWDNLSAFTYTMTYNLTGWPGVVVRGGTSPEGLPIGVQVIARPWREDVALAVAQSLERALGGRQRPPL
ncbi:MAG TPA: amidase family protein, partial [Candidatus Binatia bacterium]|nr:amidase family protein [Candidatus Binatia bacterium]